MIKIIRTTSDNPDFRELIKYLDAYLAEKDGNEHSFYAQYNKVDTIKHVVLAYQNNEAIACGAIKEFATDTMEVKRMYTSPGSRGQGIAGKVLAELETWAAELGYQKCILETGKKQTEAVGFYKKNAYQIIENYGQYAGVENSFCFEKEIKLP